MSTKAQYRAGIASFYDGTTFETVDALAPVWGSEDFERQALDTTRGWTLLTTGGVTQALVANAPNGVYSHALAATSEAELAGMSWNDKRTLVLNQGLVVEYRFKLSVLPTTGTVVAIGLAGNHNATFDTVAESIVFRADGATGGLMTVESDDTVNETSKITTGITLTANDWMIGRIDCTTITNVLFYINGAQVATGTTFNMSQVPGLVLQPYARIDKASGTSVGTVQLDYVKWWQNRS